MLLSQCNSVLNKPNKVSCGVVWTLAISLCLVACSPPEIEPPKKPKVPTRSYEVNLPAQVDLEALIPPLRYDDQTYRIDGLLTQASKVLGQDIIVKGYVTEVAQCSNKVGDECDKPYIWIAAERGDPEQRLRVVDMKRRALRRYRVGKAYAFEGRFTQSSQSGYFNSKGLLVLKRSHRLPNLKRAFKP